MSSKFFGNSRQKNSPGKKGGKHKMTNKNNKQKSSGVRKVGRGSQALIHLQFSLGCKPTVLCVVWNKSFEQYEFEVVAKSLAKNTDKALFLSLSYNSGPIAQLVRVADS